MISSFKECADVSTCLLFACFPAGFGFDDDDDNDFFSTVGGAFFDDDDGGDDCWLCWWSDDDNGADDDWFGFGGSWSNDDDDDDGWGGFLWDIGTTIVGAVCAVCGAIITGAEFIFNAVQCDSLACIGKEAFGSVVDHFTPDAISLAKSVWELGESSVSSTEYVSDTSITATCEELYGHRNSRCSDRTYFNVGSYNGHLEFVSQDDWLDSEAHDISVVVEDRDTHATRIVHETVGCVESLHSTSMVASEFAEDAYCGCVHHRHGSSFAEENHLETVDDLIAACLAESGAEFAVIKQADQEDEVTSFVEHLNHGELEARCAAGRHHNSGSLTCTSDGCSVTHVFTGITQDAPAYLTVEQAGDLDASSEYITLKIGGSTIASCKTSTTDWAIAPACKNVDVTRYVTSSGTLTVVADATYEVDADDVTATQGAELAVKFALHVQDSAPAVTTPSTSTAIDGGGGGDGTDGYDDFPFSGQAQYGFEYEELNHLYGNIFGNDYMEAYIDLLKQFSDYKGDDDDGYYSIEQAFAGCVAAKEDGCAEEYAHCALRAQRGDDTADADDYAYGSYTEHNRDICDCMSNTCQTAIDQCHAARHLAAVNWNSQYHDRDTAVYYGAMIDSHFKESRFCSAVGSARDDGVFDLHVVELRVMLKLMLHCENKALQMHADYMEKDTGFEGLRCDSEHVAEDKLIVVQLLKSIAGGMPHAEQARILTALKKHGGFATFGGAAVDGELDLDVDMKAVMADVFTSNGGADVLVAMREAGIGTDEIVRTTGISEASLLAAPPSTDTLAIESSASTVAASIVVATVAISFAVVF